MQTPDELLCPYCNQKLQNFTVPHFTSECCNRTVGVREHIDTSVYIFRPSKQFAKANGWAGDISDVQEVRK